jgi:hypothetical protein
LNSGPVLSDPYPQVFCTKWGTTRRGEMYIIGAHMDGIGYGEAANDDGRVRRSSWSLRASSACPTLQPT